jgi:probable HAF family extracellular repeat protein
MASHSYGKLTLIVRAAAFLALAQGAVTAQDLPRQLKVMPAIDVSQFVGVPSCAFALNELGVVVGMRTSYGQVRGFSWSPARTVDLEWDTTALAVNDHGDIAGYGNVLGTGLGARLWTHNGTVSSEIAVGRAYSLNDRAEVAGFHVPPSTIYHAFRWTSSAGLEDVENLAGAVPAWSYFTPFSEARFIRTDGVMAGWRDGLAVIWQPNGEFSVLGPGAANSISDRDVVVGTTSLSDGRPVVWQRGAPTIISDAPGAATDINAAGYVVGWIDVSGERHAFVWHPEHGFADLGPGQLSGIDEIGRAAGCSGIAATVWQIEMTSDEYLLGFDSYARRLLADVDPKDTRAVFREIGLAQKSAERSHASVAQRHLTRALAGIGLIAQSGQLPDEWTLSLLAIGRWIGQRF